MSNQTVNLPSRMLMLRLASCRVVLWALATHGPRLVEILNGPFGRLLPATLPEVLEPLLGQLAEVLRTARDFLIASDRDHRDQKTLLRKFRQLRDDAQEELNSYVVDLRNTVLGSYGPRITEDLGFALQTPQQAGELHEQTANLLVHLSDPAQALPASRFKTLNLDPVELAAEMRPLVEGLGQMVEEVGREERQTDATLITRIEAFEAFNRTFLWIARMVESLFRLADLPEVAKRVRPSTRRRGLTAEVEAEASETETEDAETADQDGAPEASPEDPSEDQPEAPSEDPPVAA